VHIPKADGRQKTREDKIVQRATVEGRHAIDEADFLDVSFRFRPGRSQHPALDALYTLLIED